MKNRRFAIDVRFEAPPNQYGVAFTSLLRNGCVTTTGVQITFTEGNTLGELANIRAFNSRGTEARGDIELPAEAMDELARKWLYARMQEQDEPAETEAYMAHGGIFCPFCGGKDYDGGQLDIEVGRAYQPLHCHDCEKGWYDIYALVGIEEE